MGIGLGMGIGIGLVIGIGIGQGWASVLFKRTFRSLCSFPFFIKERCVLSVLFRSL